MKVFIRFLLCLIISFTLSEAPVAQAQSGMISTTEALSVMTRGESEARVISFLEREDVKTHLKRLGVNETEAKGRLLALSDEELNQLTLQIEQNRAGGEILGILTIVLVVILIIYFAKRI